MKRRAPCVSAGFALVLLAVFLVSPAAAIEEADRDYRYQLINGRLIVTPPPLEAERGPNEELGRRLLNYRDSKTPPPETKWSDANKTAFADAIKGGKGLFVRELEQALQEKRIDIAVHSMKDLPAALTPEKVS